MSQWRPDDMVRRSFTVIAAWSCQSGTYFDALSFALPMSPRSIAMPVTALVYDFAIDHDGSIDVASWPLKYFSWTSVPCRMTSKQNDWFASATASAWSRNVSSMPCEDAVPVAQSGSG